jgi:hypothetical protein
MTQDRFLNILLLVMNLIEEAGKSQDCPTPRLIGRPSAATTNDVQLKSQPHHPPNLLPSMFISRPEEGHSL